KGLAILAARTRSGEPALQKFRDESVTLYKKPHSYTHCEIASCRMKTNNLARDFCNLSPACTAGYSVLLQSPSPDHPNDALLYSCGFLDCPALEDRLPDRWYCCRCRNIETLRGN